MTQALNPDRAARSFPAPAFTLPPRSTAKSLTLIPTSMQPTAAAQDATSEDMIQSIGKATKRMVQLLEQLHEQQRIIEELQESNECLDSRSKTAEADARYHEVRASEALLKVETLQAQQQLNTDEQDRLKASVNTLLAMFGGDENLFSKEA